MLNTVYAEKKNPAVFKWILSVLTRVAKTSKTVQNAIPIHVKTKTSNVCCLSDRPMISFGWLVDWPNVGKLSVHEILTESLDSKSCVPNSRQFTCIFICVRTRILGPKFCNNASSTSLLSSFSPLLIFLFPKCKTAM